MSVSPENAVGFVELHGIILESGHGAVPNLAEAVVGDRIRGSWWGHTQRRAILDAVRSVRNSPEILVCRLVDGKVTYVHRRLWPAVVRLAEKLGKQRLAAIHEQHTPSGRQQVTETAFPRWVSAELSRAARQLSEEQALRQLDAEWLALPID